METPERKAIISGIAQSEIGRRLHRGDLDLTVEACLRAIEDAGLAREDIDGLATYPGATGAFTPGFAGPGTPDVQDALRLNLNWHAGGLEGPAQYSAVINAIAAVATGLARHVLVYRTVTEGSAQGSGGRGGIGLPADGVTQGETRKGTLSGLFQWMLPFHAYSAANWVAMYATRYMHEYGMTPEQLAWIALNGRRNAAVNPKAIYRDPMTMDDYLNARMITTPFRLYDCDVPCDGSTAVIVSHADYAADTPHPAVRVNAVGSALRGRPSWDQWEDFPTMASRDAAAAMWERTDVTPADVDVVEAYDGFSYLTIAWLEALRLCGRGEGAAFIDGGKRIARDGELPLNTHGGQLSAGRLHGFGFIHEACVQLRGEGGERQVAGAEVAIAAAGGGPVAGCLLLTR
jgi:acetyl-CoA acetyltransferase